MKTENLANVLRNFGWRPEETASQFMVRYKQNAIIEGMKRAVEICREERNKEGVSVGFVVGCEHCLGTIQAAAQQLEKESGK